jgi:putative peptidoglycan lipid II flippase
VPASLGLICYSRDIIRVLFERGAFEAQATGLTSSALAFYAPGLAFLSLNTLITKIYYSMHDTKTAVKCSALSVLLNIVLNLMLVGPMGHAGLALATSISHMANTALLCFTFRRRYPSVKLISSFRTPVLVLVLSVLAVGASRLLYKALGSGLLKLALCCGLAALIYLALLRLFRFEDIGLLKQLVKGKKEG